jgi:hypothetical protein
MHFKPRAGVGHSFFGMDRADRLGVVDVLEPSGDDLLGALTASGETPLLGSLPSSAMLQEPFYYDEVGGPHKAKENANAAAPHLHCGYLRFHPASGGGGGGGGDERVGSSILKRSLGLYRSLPISAMHHQEPLYCNEVTGPQNANSNTNTAPHSSVESFKRRSVVNVLAKPPIPVTLHKLNTTRTEPPISKLIPVTLHNLKITRTEREPEKDGTPPISKKRRRLENIVVSPLPPNTPMVSPPTPPSLNNTAAERMTPEQVPTVAHHAPTEEQIITEIPGFEKLLYANGRKEYDLVLPEILPGLVAWDVLCERQVMVDGNYKSVFNTVGNCRFRVLLSANVKGYHAVPQKKPGFIICNDIMDAIHWAGGRFLKQVNGEWKEVAYLKAHKTVAYSLKTLGDKLYKKESFKKTRTIERSMYPHSVSSKLDTIHSSAAGGGRFLLKQEEEVATHKNNAALSLEELEDKIEKKKKNIKNANAIEKAQHSVEEYQNTKSLVRMHMLWKQRLAPENDSLYV